MSQVLDWSIQALAKTGTLAIIGVYPPLLIEKGELDCRPFITYILPFDQIIEAYKNFDKRKENWIKVVFTL